ncbi:DEHA2F20416p [Debaryomyces hansenii CBS767]|uniref:DEHA2F20416p n=1 Tax=Debaryomyces hansenii (strain ATCC 36239 / CBS 767 / BCRC 21394 / JCM 1990 / NBRC 0083 / IGC 2968) TaxID=284592 RepID=Q6BKN6_DEBHA|nr:DEHA2F20416p [Debaryomyces hansenii CBS767]CAG89623.2 DEHA2F20416p [Debaryomyces hansenii CBS767]|eukprot:XP_461235.2 DEHA2F20416p [Debaryomyces hansenii CBS767]
MSFLWSQCSKNYKTPPSPEEKRLPEYAWGFDLIGPEQPITLFSSVCCSRFVQPNFQWPSVV